MSDDDEPPQAVEMQPAMGDTGPASVKNTLKSSGVPTPVTLITGWLGAGKSTLIRRVLHEKHGYRVAVIMNEYAEETGIEGAMVQVGDMPAEAANWIEIGNGCLCCSVKSDFVRALDGLAERSDQFDYILIETTGLADPGPVAAALWPDDEIESSVRLDAIVTVVDAKTICHSLHAAPGTAGAVNEAQQQVAYADIILLNKVDLLDAHALEQVEGELRLINQDAAVTRCRHCDVKLGSILDVGTYAMHAASMATSRQVTAADQSDTQPQQQHHSGRGHSQHQHHSQQVGTCSFHLPGRLDLERLRTLLDHLLWEETGEARDMYRVKGLLNISSAEQPFVLQAVHELYDITPATVPNWSTQHESRIVFIGRNLDRDALHKGLVNCLC